MKSLYRFLIGFGNEVSSWTFFVTLPILFMFSHIVLSYSVHS